MKPLQPKTLFQLAHIIAAATVATLLALSLSSMLRPTMETIANVLSNLP